MGQISPDFFKELLLDELLPLFPGSQIFESTWTGNKNLVAWLPGGQKILIKQESNSPIRYELSRYLPFNSTERILVDKFVRYINKLSAHNIEPILLRKILSKTFSTVIAQVIYAGNSDIIASIISEFEHIADRTYEGKNISLCCIIDLANNQDSGISYLDVIREKHGHILSNGLDTVVMLSCNGHVETIKRLTDPEKDCFAPFRYLKISSQAIDNKIAIALNRNKEILVFKKGELLFSKRRGIWQHYSNVAIYKQLIYDKYNPHANIRTALYLSSLDVSFSHGGGCIAVIAPNCLEYVKNTIIRSGDLFGNATNLKSKHMAHIFKNNFKDIDRLVRAEMIAVDGATILDHSGNIIAAGAIIKVEQASEDGARTAAARTLAQYGVSIKISVDGEIKVFRNNPNNVVDIAYQYA